MNLRKIKDAFFLGYTLIFLISNDKDREVLLLKRKTEPAKGKLTGVGGHIEFDENKYQCAVRELQEETGIITDKLNYIGYSPEIKSHVFYGLVESFYPLSLPVRTTEGVLNKYKLKDINNLGLDEIIKGLLIEIIMENEL